MNQVAIGILASTCWLLIAMCWVHRRGQSLIDRSLRHSVIIALKVIVLSVMFHGILLWLALPTNMFRTCSFVATLLIVIPARALVEAVGAGSDPFSVFASGLIISPVIVVYFIKQFVLGWPDILQFATVEAACPIQRDQPESRFQVGDFGEVVASLRPLGTVEIGGQRASASAIDNSLISVGTRIEVRGFRGDLVLVAMPVETAIELVTKVESWN